MFCIILVMMYIKCFQFVSIISITFVVLSTAGMTANTIPSVGIVDADGNPADNPKLAMIEAICIMWFTIEYLLRLAGTYSTMLQFCCKFKAVFGEGERIL